MYILATIIVFLLTVFVFIGNLFGFRSFHMYVYEYWDFGSLIVLLLFSLFILMATGKLKDFKNAVRYSVGKKGGASTLKALKEAQDAVVMLSQALIYGSVFISFFCGVDLLFRMDNPAALGPSLSIILLTIVYAMFIEMILLVVRVNLQKKIQNYLEADVEVKDNKTNMEAVTAQESRNCKNSYTVGADSEKG